MLNKTNIQLGVVGWWLYFDSYFFHRFFPREGVGSGLLLSYNIQKPTGAEHQTKWQQVSVFVSLGFTRPGTDPHTGSPNEPSRGITKQTRQVRTWKKSVLFPTSTRDIHSDRS